MNGGPSLGVSPVLAETKNTVWLLSLIVPLLGGMVVFFVLLLLIVRRQRKRMDQREATGVDPLEASGTLELAASPEEALVLAKTALSKLRRKYGTDVLVDSESRRVRCQTAMTRRSWGQMVVVDVDPSGRGSTVRCRSWPLSNTVISDRGEGRRLVDSVLNVFADKDGEDED